MISLKTVLLLAVVAIHLNDNAVDAKVKFGMRSKKFVQTSRKSFVKGEVNDKPKKNHSDQSVTEIPEQVTIGARSAAFDGNDVGVDPRYVVYLSPGYVYRHPQVYREPQFIDQDNLVTVQARTVSPTARGYFPSYYWHPSLHYVPSRTRIDQMNEAQIGAPAVSSSRAYVPLIVPAAAIAAGPSIDQFNGVQAQAPLLGGATIDQSNGVVARYLVAPHVGQSNLATFSRGLVYQPIVNNPSISQKTETVMLRGEDGALAQGPYIDQGNEFSLVRMVQPEDVQTTILLRNHCPQDGSKPCGFIAQRG